MDDWVYITLVSIFGVFVLFIMWWLWAYLRRPTQCTLRKDVLNDSEKADIVRLAKDITKDKKKR